MLRRTARGLLALLLCLGVPLGARAQPEVEAEDVELKLRLQQIRALYAQLQEASKGPARIDKKSKAKPAQWYRLRAWETPDHPKGTLHKLVVSSRDKSGELERSFYLKDDLLFFAHYVRTSRGSAKERMRDEERMYFDLTTGTPIRWQHNNDIQDNDGHALRWGEQARSDAVVARALAGDDASTARFEPITCVVGDTKCTGEHGGNYCTTKNALFPPPGLPVQEDLCMDQPWFAGQNVTCDFEQEGLTLTVTRSFQQVCPDGEENCVSEGSESTTVDLSPEMGRVKECSVY